MQISPYVPNYLYHYLYVRVDLMLANKQTKLKGENK